MNIDIALVGQFFLLSAIVTMVLCYQLGKRKTQNVKTTLLVGFLLSLTPPLGLLYVDFLSLKNDVITNKPTNY